MSDKPEALRLADELYVASLGIKHCLEALSATELRRLHADNERLTADNERLKDELRNWKKSFVGHVYVKNEDYAELVGKRDALKTDNERLKAERDEAVRAEREACAKVCEQLVNPYAESVGSLRHATLACAAAIRERGQEPPR